jgi:DNA-binding GntR family transcriptional regulator
MTLDQHDQIADSLRKRDTRQISIALRNHLDTTINNISEDQEENLSKPHENHPL